MAFIHRVIYKGGHKDFPIKAHRTGGKIVVTDEPYGEIAKVLYEEEFQGRRIIELKFDNNNQRV